MVTLVIFRGSTIHDVVESPQESITIGRASWNTVVLDHPSVSRDHARILVRESGMEVVDLGSKNGVVLKGIPVKSATIVHGDVLQIGEFRFHVHAPPTERGIGKTSQGEKPSAPRREGNPGSLLAEGALEETYRALETLFQLSSRFPTMVDTNQLLEHMIDCLRQIFQAERGQILLVDPKTGRFQVTIARKIDPKTPDYAISETIAREVLSRKVPILTTDALAETKFQEVDSIQREQIRSVVCVPLIRPADKRTIGVLYLDSRAKQKVFSNREVALLDTFASNAVEAIENAREKDRLKKLVLSLQAAQRDSNLREHNFQNIVASNRKMIDVLTLVTDVASEDVTCLVLGESGTGKELIAKAIHYNSKRKDRPFVAVNCMALSPEVIESELFGHERGSFTGACERRIGRFEMADGGTLFLDEIGELSGAIQVKLLRVLQERQIERVGGSRPTDVDVRLVAATHADLPKHIKTGRFREDLYYRLNVLTITIPPLRQRLEDIPPLVDHFIDHFNSRMQRKLVGIDPDALSILMSYSWPGNIRELKNVIERAFVVEREQRITASSLPHDIVQGRGRGFSSNDLGVDNYPPDFHLAKELFEKNFILKYLRVNSGNIAATATQLGLPRKTIYRKLEAYQIPRDQLGDEPPDD